LVDPNYYDACIETFYSFNYSSKIKNVLFKYESTDDRFLTCYHYTLKEVNKTKENDTYLPVYLTRFNKCIPIKTRVMNS